MRLLEHALSWKRTLSLRSTTVKADTTCVPAVASVSASPAMLMALEPRLMFDAAAVSTGAEAAVHSATRPVDPSASHAVDAPAAVAVAAAAPPAPQPAPAPPPAPAVVVEAAAPAHHEVVFISDQVADPQALAAAVRPQVDTVVLDSHRDGLAQISQYLAGHAGVDAVHIVSHGSPGGVELGNTWLTSQTLASHADALARLGAAMAPGGDLLFYGCDVGAGAEGAAFLGQVSRASGLDVAASIDTTGSATSGGDWDLEAHAGQVTTAGAFDVPSLASYRGVLSISDENFDSRGLLQTYGTSLVVGSWTFTSSVATDIETPDQNEQAANLNLDGTPSDRNLMWNLGGVGSGLTVGLKSTDGTDFALNSFRFGSAFGTTSATLTGWRDGIQVVAGEVVNFAASDSVGNITYSFTGTNSGGSYGLLSFNSAFGNVDEIRVAFANDTTAEIDDIDISPVAVSDTTPPTASIVVADTALKGGETSLVTVTFSEAVTGFTNADLTVANGSLSAVSSSDGGVTWTATLTPTANLTDATNLITLNNPGVSDLAGNAGVGTTNSNNYAIDTQRPTAGIVVADNALSTGETSLVTITFSEAVTGFTNADLTVANGSLSAVSSSDGGITWTATLTPTANLTDTTNLITLNNTGVSDLAGNAGVGTTDSNNYAIDTQRPTAGIVVADNALSTGETSLVTITFSEAVTGFTNADLTVANGSLSAVSSSDGGITWTATLTPTANLTDATNLITLNNTGVSDLAGNAGVGTTDSNNYAIDTQRPTAGIVVADNALSAGETSLVTITFSEAVTGFTNADLTVANGSLSAVSSSDGGITWTATLTPTANLTDTTNLITLNNTGVADLAGNAGVGTTDSNNYAIDTQRPTAGIVVADNALSAGETSLVTITFSEAVTGFTNADLTVANGSLSAVSSSDGGITWTATLTPTANLTDATNLITLNNTGVADLAGNAGVGTTDSNNYAIDTQRPTAGIVVADNALSAGETSLVTITFSEAVTGFSNADLTVANGSLSAVNSSDGGITWTATLTPAANLTDVTNVITLDNTGVIDAAGNTGLGTTDSNNYAVVTSGVSATLVVADTALAAGETSLVTITFSEAVTGFTNADLTVANGSLSAVSSSDGGVTWTATLTPTANLTDATNVITLDNAGVTSVSTSNPGAGSTSSNNYAIDTQRPTAGIVVADNALSAGETSLVTITFSEAVTGFTNADLTVANGSLSAVSSSDGGITWTATLTPNAGVTQLGNTVVLDNAGISDVAGNAGLGTTASNVYGVDTASPAVTHVSLPASGTYASGDTIDLTVHFSEAVTVDASGGTPRIAVDLDQGGRVWADYVSGSGSADLVFRLPVVSGQADANGIVLAGAIDLNGGRLQDAAGNEALSALNGVPSTAGLQVDGVAPVIVSVAPPADRLYRVGEAMTFTLGASEAVLIDTRAGTPRLAIDFAGATAYAELVSGAGTDTLVFRHIVQAGDNAAAGVSVVALQLQGAQIADAAGNALSPDLPPTPAHSGVVVDTAAPEVSAIARLDSTPTSADTVRYSVTFTEAVSGVDAGDFTLSTTPGVTGRIDSLTAVDAHTYWVTVVGVGGQGRIGLSFNANGSGVVDAAGNAIATGSVGLDYDIQAVVVPLPAATPIVVDRPAPRAEVTAEPLPAVTLAPLAPLSNLAAVTLAPGTRAVGDSASVVPMFSAPLGTTSLEPAALGVPNGVSMVPPVAARGFVDVTTAQSSAGLRSIPDIGEASVRPGAPLNLSLPEATFTHSDRNAQLSFEVRLADGRPLPPWLRFDAATGTLSGRAPEGAPQNLTIEIVVRDAKGQRARSQLELQVRSPAETTPAAPPRPPNEPRAQFQPQDAVTADMAIDAALPGSALASDGDMSVGRASLQAQFGQHGGAAQRAAAEVLLAHLQAASQQSPSPAP